MSNSARKIDHPTHYNRHPSGVECIDIVEHFSFNIGNAIKYLWRAGLKYPPDTATQKAVELAALEDLKKSAWYIAREISNRTRSDES